MKKKTTKKRKKGKTTKKNRREKKTKIATTRSKGTSKMMNWTPCSSLMPLPLNFSEKALVTRSVPITGLKLLVFV